VTAAVQWGPGGMVGEHQPDPECWGCVAIFADEVRAWYAGRLRSDLSDQSGDLLAAFGAWHKSISRTSHVGWGEPEEGEPD